MKRYPTDLLGWAEEMDRAADVCRDEGFPRSIEEGNRALAKMLRQAAAEIAALRERNAMLNQSMAKVVAHTAYLRGASSDLLTGLLDSCRRIAEQALAAQESKETQP
jgi:hypothetical protein